MSFSSLTLRPGDVIVLKVNVGALPATRAKEYIEKIKGDFKEIFGQDQKIVTIATQEPTELCIINLDL